MFHHLRQYRIQCVPLHFLPSGLSHPRPQTGIRRQLSYCGGKGRLIPPREQEPVLRSNQIGMSLCVAGHHRQAAGHALHDVEGQPLRPAGGYGDIRRTQPHGDVADLTGKPHALRHAQLISQGAARLQPCAAARQQQLDLRRQQRQGAEQHRLCLPLGELRRIDQRNVLLRQAQLVPHSLPRLPRRLKAAELHAHTGDLLHPGRRVMRRGPLGVPRIHGQHQIGL